MTHGMKVSAGIHPSHAPYALVARKSGTRQGPRYAGRYIRRTVYASSVDETCPMEDGRDAHKAMLVRLISSSVKSRRPKQRETGVTAHDEACRSTTIASASYTQGHTKVRLGREERIDHEERRERSANSKEVTKECGKEA